MSLPNRLVVMYHSVDGPTPAVIGSFPIAFERFEQQIALLRRHGYVFCTLDEMRQAPAHERCVALTGDDGTVDWAENVLPFCEAEDIPTLTAVITGVWEQPAIWPLAHVLQVVLSLRPRQRLEQLAGQLAQQLDAAQTAYVQRIYAYETDPVRRMIKGACNLVLDMNMARGLIEPLTEEEETALQRRFSQPDHYRSYRQAILAPHTRSHAPIEADIERYLREEILPSADMLKEKGLDVAPWFVAPMRPRFGAEAEALQKGLQAHGYHGMLTADAGCWDGVSFQVPRIDAVKLETMLNGK